MLNLFRRKRVSDPRPAYPPPQTEGLVYAIGDVHGRFDLLDRLIAAIWKDCQRIGVRARLVFLGDYVDRGEGSREVIAYLRAADGWPEADCIFLTGNHEDMLLAFLDDPVATADWLKHGGLQTLMSYGVRGTGDWRSAEGLRALGAELTDAVAEDRAFLETLAPWHRSGNVFFVHAGAEPDLPPEAQSRATLLWGSPRFLTTPRRDGLWVVHGHTVVEAPQIVGTRIAIDTGAYFSGRLTAARFWDGAVTFLTA